MFKVGDRVRMKRDGTVTEVSDFLVWVRFGHVAYAVYPSDINPATTEVSVGIEKTCKRMAAIQLEKLEASGMTGDFGTQSEESRQAELEVRREARARTKVSGIVIDNYGLGLSINGERASIHDFTDSQLESMSALCEMELMERCRTETTEDAE